jgi:ribonuclease D
LSTTRKVKYQIIDTVSRLENFVRAFEIEKAVAVDLEADSMYHFREKVCLIQMATTQANVVIDPLLINDLSPLKPIFASPDIQKIVHGADYDVRSLYRDFGIEINNLFDTELASRFLGTRETGLDAVVQKLFQVKLNKKYQKKDWSKRPLPEKMMEYAAQDVIYLAPLAQILEKELERMGRLTWVKEECRHLTKVRPVSNHDEPLFLKFKGAGRLKPRSLAILEALLRYRMQIAQKKDKPLFKVFSNGSVMKMTTKRPLTLRRLKGIKALSDKQIRMYGRALVEIVNQSLRIPEAELPIYPRKKPPQLEPDVPRRVKALKRWRDAKAQKLAIEPGLLCNKALLCAVAIENPKDTKHLGIIKEMKKWQKKEFGRDMIAVLSKF